jgi:hypothetical protein
MTDAEREKRDAEEFAALVGGIIALLIAGRGTFDRRRGTWSVDGRTLTGATMRNLLARIERLFGQRAASVTRQWFNKSISLAEWRVEMNRNIRSAHLVAATLAVGAIEDVWQTADVLARIDREEAFASAFANQLRRNAVGSEQKAIARAKSYALAATITYGVAQQLHMAGVGYTEAKRIRRAVESCEGCRQYAGRWLPIAEMPPLGSLDCGGRCRCYLEYR